MTMQIVSTSKVTQLTAAQTTLHYVVQGATKIGHLTP